MLAETAVRPFIGQYRIESTLGRGGMGVVYRGLHDHLGREVAIKALAPELTQQPEFRERFFAEAKTQARLQHPNIVAVYDLLEDAGEYFIVMEFVAGQGLDDQLRAAPGGRMELGTAFAVFSQVLSALDYAHSEGVIHRDVKPSNVMITAGGRVKLTDFGIALLVGDKRLTASQSSIGTPTYMSPEQILRPRALDHRTDIYSAAVVFYEMLAGKPPFDDETDYGIKRLHVEATPPDLAALNPSLPAGVVAAIAVALNKNPDDRFPSAGAFLRALQEAAPLAMPTVPIAATPLPQPIPRATGLDAPARRPDPRAGSAAGARRPLLQGRSLWIAAGAAALVLAIGVGVLSFFLASRGGGPDGVAAMTAAADSVPRTAARAVPAPVVPVRAAPLAQVPPPSEPAAAAVTPPPVKALEPRPTPPARVKPPVPEPQAAAPPPVVAETPKPPAEASPPAVTRPAEEPASPAAARADSAATLPGDVESVILSIERLSGNAQEAYANEEQPNEVLNARLEEFVDAASGVRKAFRKTTGKGFGALKDKLLRRSAPEADRKALEVQAKELVRRGAHIDELIATSPMGPAAMGYWKEIRSDLKRLTAAFG